MQLPDFPSEWRQRAEHHRRESDSGVGVAVARNISERDRDGLRVECFVTDTHATEGLIRVETPSLGDQVEADVIERAIERWIVRVLPRDDRAQRLLDRGTVVLRRSDFDLN